MQVRVVEAVARCLTLTHLVRRRRRHAGVE
jgi:hypothetical protein